MAGKTAVLIGGSGLVGSEVLKLILASADYGLVKSISRKSLLEAHREAAGSEKLKEFLTDMTPDLSGVSDEAFEGDVAFCCIGTTRAKAGSAEEFRRVDYTLAKQFAERCAKNEVTKIGLVSSGSANHNSMFLYLKTKGEAEQVYLNELPESVRTVAIVRPSLLVGDRKETRIAESIGVSTAWLYSWALPAHMKPIKVEDVAKHLVRLLSDQEDQVMKGVRQTFHLPLPDDLKTALQPK